MRFEDTISNRFSWGICLDKIETYTTNAAGEKTFVDRTIAINKKEPMKKLLVISNACAYWNARETRMISQLAEEQKLKILNGMILREGEAKTAEPADFLFKITSSINLVMSNKDNFSEPDIKVYLDNDSPLLIRVFLLEGEPKLRLGDSAFAVVVVVVSDSIS